MMERTIPVIMGFEIWNEDEMVSAWDSLEHL
jgi:uncharacterized protein YuzE